MSPLLLVAVALLGVSVYDIVRRPMFRRLAFRNVARRRGEASLVVAGAMLGTAIITASFLVGDTLNGSIRDIGRTQLGPTDEQVTVRDLRVLADVEKAVTEPPIPRTDGTLRLVATGAVAATVGPGDRRVEPHGALIEIDFDAARRFGADPAATGFAGAGPTPGDDQADIGDGLARETGARPGDRIEVFAFGTSRTVTVRAVLPLVGVAGWGSGGGRVFGGSTTRGTGVFVAPGTIAAMYEQGRGLLTPPAGAVLVSNDGGVFDGVRHTAEVEAALRQRTAGIPGVEVRDSKQQLLDDAKQAGDSIGEIFTGIGGFSVIAGILLLVNIFVMLAEERKVELGVMRAVGLKRGHLVRAFGLEGAIYSVMASAVGVVLGIVVGRGIVQVTKNLFAQDEGLALRFTADPASLTTGFLVGLVISLVTVWLTSFRISRLNVIRSIRDLPEPPAHGRRLRSLALGSVGVVAGGLMLMSGISRGAEIGALGGPPLAFFSAIPLLTGLLPRRVVVTVLCIMSLLWGSLVFTILPGVMDTPSIFVFVVQGVVLVAAAVSLLQANDQLWYSLAERFSRAGRGLSSRLGLAYPLARRFRTGMILGMYSLVIFTLTFISVIAGIFVKQAPTLANEVRAGYDILVTANGANTVSAERLAAEPEVGAVAPLVVGFPQFTTEFQREPRNWPMSGYDERLLALGTMKLSSREPQFATDEDAFRAVMADPGRALVPDFFLREGGPPEAALEAGDRVGLIDPVTQQRRELIIAGMVSSDFVFNGVLVSREFSQQFLGPRAAESRHYVAARDGVDPAELARDLEGRFLVNGVEAETFSNLIDDQLAVQQGFMRLMQGYLGLGLLIGIAGLGVVMVRAVRERRRQIGMLRAMGFSPGIIRQAFLLEAAFITIQGIAVGIVLGLLTSFQLISNSGTFRGSSLPFSVPWFALVVILAVPLGASLAAAAAPATAAARIKPAVALRIAD